MKKLILVTCLAFAITGTSLAYTPEGNFFQYTDSDLAHTGFPQSSLTVHFLYDIHVYSSVSVDVSSISNAKHVRK